MGSLKTENYINDFIFNHIFVALIVKKLGYIFLKISYSNYMYVL